MVPSSAVLEQAKTFAGLKPKANCPPLFDSVPNLSMTTEELAINQKAWDALRAKPRYAGLVGSCSPPEYYVYNGDVKISLARHLKALVALVYSLQSLQMDRSNVHFKVSYRTT